jgi:uncharacterized protein YxjI
MNYPLTLSFKKFALASQIYMKDANGNLLGYVKQKLFKLKEDINVFADEGQTQHLFNIKADRVIDFSANYRFTGSAGNPIGAIRRKGMRSIFKANYEISDGAGNHVLNINEENGWVKVMDSLFGEIPIIGMFAGYVFNPTYLVTRIDGTPLARVSKVPAFLQGEFKLEPLAQLAGDEETRVLLGVLTMTLLERMRG